MKRSVYVITLLAFILRLGLGLGAYQLLPRVGYESKPQQAGYLFFDAYRRDKQAWELAQSSKPLLRAFDDKFSSDQYGGLLWISAFIYRYLSGGTQQPLLVMLLAALVGSLGVLFVYLSTRRLAGEKTALLSALIFALFPEAILLGAAQMREPFLMTFIAMAFYGLVEWQSNGRKTAWFWMLLAAAGMLLISPGFVAVTLVALAGWYYFSRHESPADKKSKFPWQAAAAAVGLFALALVLLASSWDSLVAVKGGGFLGIIANWARGTARWNAYLLERSSGIVQLLFQALPPVLALPFVTVYGVLQPVLPAVILEPGIPFWQIIGFFRALGWYLLLPLAAFAPIAAASLPTGQQREGKTAQVSSRGWLWLSLVVWIWIFIAALRGGGDQWDNPRYRVILLAWIAPLAALAFSQVYAGRARRWFWRICAVELIVLLVFGHWYSWRYLGLGFNIGIRNTLIIAIGLAVLVVAGDLLWQRFKPSSRL